MEDEKIMRLQKEVERLQGESSAFLSKNQKLERALEFNRDYIEMAAKLKAVEYIVRSSDYSISRERLAEILDIKLPQKVGGNDN